MTAMTIDVQKLRSDTAKARATRIAENLSRPPVTGAMALVRQLLPTIEKMLNDNRETTWNDVAAALVKRGYVALVSAEGV